MTKFRIFRLLRLHGIFKIAERGTDGAPLILYVFYNSISVASNLESPFCRARAHNPYIPRTLMPSVPAS
jgi:hypothetical protein